MEGLYEGLRVDDRQVDDRIADSSRSIDLRVYRIYGLTDEEIKIMETN
jgi:hypothetical protein